MLRKWIAPALLTLGVAGAAHAASQDYKVDGFARVTGKDTSELVVRILNVRTGAYVSDATVWHFTATGLGPLPYSLPLLRLRHDVAPDVANDYVIELPMQVHARSFEHFMATIPGEDEPVHARVQISVRR